MKVQILENCLSTIDGFRVEKFHKGEVYDLREFVATNLINQRKAKFMSNKVKQGITKNIKGNN